MVTAKLKTKNTDETGVRVKLSADMLIITEYHGSIFK